MDSAEVKLQMMKLWKSVFHDSDDYIKLVFDNYFSPERVAYKEKDGKIISALLSVPYNFVVPKITLVSGDDDVCETMKYLKGLYLCGLSTEESFRGRGLMNDLMQEMELRAFSEGFSFTFLIPASEGLIKYYADRGYSNSIFRVDEHYISQHRFLDKKQCATLLSFNLLSGANVGEIAECSFESNGEGSFFKVISLSCLIDDIKKLHPEDYSICVDNLFCLLGNKLCNIELRNNLNSKFLGISHSPKDYELVLRENILSGNDVLFLITDESYYDFQGYLINGIQNEILNKAINILQSVFVENSSDGKEFIVRKIVNSEYDVKRNCDNFTNIILEILSRIYPEYDITLCIPPINISQNALSQNYFRAYNNIDNTYQIADWIETPSSSNSVARPYGMSKILSAYEILKFIGNRSGFLKYSILVKDEFCSASRITWGKNEFQEKNKLDGENVINHGLSLEPIIAPVLYEYDKNNSVINMRILDERGRKETEHINSGNPEFLSVTRQELAELLFGRIQKDKIIDSALVLPSVRMDAWLLLD